MVFKTSENGVNFIKKEEALRLASYYDSQGILTIGWGSTTNVSVGMIITQAEAEHRLKTFLEWQDYFMSRYITKNVTQNQWDAVSSLAYNIGCGTVAHYDLVKKLNSGDILGAADEFLDCNKAINQNTKKMEIVAGLTNRRHRERELFLKI